MREGAASDVDRQADMTVDILTRLGAIEKVGHIHQPGGGYLHGRNKLGNATARICQRATSLAGIATDAGQKAVDRMGVRNNALGIVTLSQVVDAPAGTGLVYSLKAQFTTADAAPAAADYCFFSEGIEGVEAQDLLWGTANAKPVTFGVFVKASITGTFIAALYRAEATPRHIGQAFTVAVANVWLYYSFTFPGDQTTAITNDSVSRINCEIWYGAGTNFNSGALQTAWGNSNNPGRAAGVTNLAATINNSIQITGWQFEAGSAPSPLEILRYDADLLWCMKYYERINCPTGGWFGIGLAVNTTNAYCFVPLAVPKRIGGTPAFDLSAASSFGIWTGSGSAVVPCTAVAISAWSTDARTLRADATTAGSLSGPGQAAPFVAASAAYIGISLDI